MHETARIVGSEPEQRYLVTVSCTLVQSASIVLGYQHTLGWLVRWGADWLSHTSMHQVLLVSHRQCCIGVV